MQVSQITALRAFQSQNFTYYFLGRSITQFGTWMQRTAVVWVVYSITQSPFMVGVTVFAEQFPSFLFSFAGGVIADRYDRTKIIRITQIAAVIQTVLLAVMLLLGHLVVWQILALSVFLGIISAFDVPARQTLIHDVVRSDNDIASALSINSAMSNVSKILGPAAAGFALEHLNVGWCFVLIAFAFTLVIWLFSKIKIEATAPISTRKNIVIEFQEGISYLRQHANIGLVILMLCVVGFFVLPYDTLLPAIAKVTFDGGAATFGFLTGAIAIGGVMGTFVLATLKNRDKLRYCLIISTILLGLGMICFSLMSSFTMAILFCIVIGFGAVMQFTCSNIIVQSEVDPKIRGRIISLLLTAIFGMVPLGSLLIGFVSQHIGSTYTLIIQGIIAIIIALIFGTLFKKYKTSK